MSFLFICLICPICGSSLFALDQHRPIAALGRLAALVDDGVLHHHIAAAQAREGLLIDDLDLDVDGIADVDRQAELGIQLAKGQHRALDDARLHGQPGGDGLDEQAVGHALAKHLLPAILGIGVDQVVVARQGGKVDTVGLGDGSPDALDSVTDLELLEVEPAGAGKAVLAHELAPCLTQCTCKLLDKSYRIRRRRPIRPRNYDQSERVSTA